MYNRMMLLADDVIYTSDRDLSGETIASVVITGIAVVFLILVLLIALVWLYGKIFQAVNARADAKKASQQSEEPEKAEVKPAASAPAIELEDVEEETAAVIAAAIAAYGAQTGKKLAVRSIKRTSSGVSPRNAWAAAGLAEATKPF